MAAFISHLRSTNAQLDFFRSEYSGIQHLEEIIHKTLRRIELRSETQAGLRMAKNGSWSIQSFDGWFAPIVRKELGKTLGIIRNKAIAKARVAGAGSASTAVLRREYKDEYKVNVNILGNSRRISSKTRSYPAPTGGKSGIRRNRSISERTKKLYGYYGPDRSFILRFLNSGTDTRTAEGSGPSGRGSKATYGNRGMIAPRNFFHSLHSDMELAANHLGDTLINHVENWLNTEFTEEQK